MENMDKIMEKLVVTVKDYDRIDGRNAYNSPIKQLTLGSPVREENKNMQIAAQIWQENEKGELEISMELPIHQVMDLMILLSRTLLYFREAYRLPLMYNPENPMVERVGIQGDAMSVEICTENPKLNEEIQNFSQAINDLGELTGARFRVLSKVIEELEY